MYEVKERGGQHIEQKGGWKKRKQGQKNRCNGRREEGRR
jgi:hypothetical protein